MTNPQYRIRFKVDRIVYHDCDGGIDHVVPAEWRWLGSYANTYDHDTAHEIVEALGKIDRMARVVPAGEEDVL